MKICYLDSCSVFVYKQATNCLMNQIFNRMNMKARRLVVSTAFAAAALSAAAGPAAAAELQLGVVRGRRARDDADT